MIKKFVMLISLVSLLFLFIGCDNNDSGDTVTPIRGRWIDDVYVSEYLGIEFELPEGLYILEGIGSRAGDHILPSERPNWMGFTREEFSPYDFRGEIGIRAMAATRESSHMHSLSLKHAGVTIHFRELSEEYTELSEIDILENWLFHSHDIEDIELLEATPERVLLGGSEWYSIRGTLSEYYWYGAFRDLHLREFEIRRLVNVYGGFLRSIFLYVEIVGESTELIWGEVDLILTLDEIFNHFRDLPTE